MGQILRFPESVDARIARIWRQTQPALSKMSEIKLAACEALARGDIGAGKPAMADIDSVELPADLGLLARAAVRDFQLECIEAILRKLIAAEDTRKRLEAERLAADPA